MNSNRRALSTEVPAHRPFSNGRRVEEVDVVRAVEVLHAFGGISVVDAATGVRKASLCSGATELGLATPAGVLCAKAPIEESDWAGKETSTGIGSSRAALQPGGASIACTVFGGNSLLWSSGSTRTLPAPPVGWVGRDHLLLSSSQTGTQLFDVGSGTMQPVDVVAAWTVGAIPGGL